MPRGPRGSIAVSADGGRVAVVSAIRITIVDAATGEKRHTLERPGLEGVFHAVAFGPDGRLLISGIGGTTGGVQVWDAATGELRREFSTGLGGVTRVAVFPGGSRAASAGTDDAVTVWDLTAPPER